MTIQVHGSVKRQTLGGRLAQRVRNSVIVIEQAINRAHRAVVYLEIDIRLCTRLLLPRDAAHEIVEPEWAVDIADQVGTPLCKRVVWHSILVVRQVHQHACLHFLTRFLNECYFRRNRRTAGVTCALHRHTPIRLGKHVKTKGALVTPVEWLDINNGGIFTTCARRENRVIRETFSTDRAQMFIQARRWNIDCKTDALYARVLLLNSQTGDIVPPLGSGYTLRRGEQPDTATQHVLIALYTLENGVGHL